MEGRSGCPGAMLRGGCFREKRLLRTGLQSPATTGDETPPARALPFAQWLLRTTRLHWDIVEDAVEALRDAHPERFNDPYLGDAEDVIALHHTPLPDS